MALKIFAGLIAIALAIAFLAPPIVKLKDVMLIIVVLIGVVMMVIDVGQSLRSKED